MYGVCSSVFPFFLFISEVCVCVCVCVFIFYLLFLCDFVLVLWKVLGWGEFHYYFSQWLLFFLFFGKFRVRQAWWAPASPNSFFFCVCLFFCLFLFCSCFCWGGIVLERRASPHLTLLFFIFFSGCLHLGFSCSKKNGCFFAFQRDLCLFWVGVLFLICSKTRHQLSLFFFQVYGLSLVHCF